MKVLRKGWRVHGFIYKLFVSYPISFYVRNNYVHFTLYFNQ